MPSLSSFTRRAVTGIAAGAVLSGVAVLSGATATATTTTTSTTATAAMDRAAGGTAEPTTLRDAAAGSGRFMGSAIADHRLGDSTYNTIAAREFSSVTAENVMKWEALEPTRGQYEWEPADRLVDFAERNDQLVYGHVLVWHNQLPAWLRDGDFGATELRQIMTDHISTVVGRYRGRIQRWDVVNEALNEDGTLRNTKWLQTLGEDYIADALRAAHAADPDAKLFLNDYNTDGVNAKSDGMYRLVKRLLAEGVPIHGVGFQSHMVLDRMPASYQENLQRFADLGLEVVVTELDVRIQLPADTGELARQARQYQDVTQACLNVSRCAGITVWGLSDRDSWVPGWFEGEGAATLYDEEYRPKPAYHAVLDTFAAGAGGRR